MFNRFLKATIYVYINTDPVYKKVIYNYACTLINIYIKQIVKQKVECNISAL